MEINKCFVYTFKLRGRKELITGIVVDYSQEWIMIKYIPVDYVIDGYRIIKKKYISTFWRKDDEEFKEVVIKAKKIDFSNHKIIPIENTNEMFNFFLKNNIVIQFDLNDESIAYIGLLTKILSKSFYIKNLSPKGIWIDEQSFKIESIRTIQIDNDYIISLLALNPLADLGL